MTPQNCHDQETMDCAHGYGRDGWDGWMDG